MRRWGGAHGRTTIPVLSGHLARAGSQWFLLWVFAVVTGPVGVGQLSLAMALATPLTILSELALRNLYLTLSESPGFRTYVVIRVVGASGTAAILIAISFTGLGPSDEILLPLAGIKFWDSILDLLLGELQRRAKIAWVGLILTINATGTILLAGVTLLAGWPVQGILWASALVSALVTISLAAAIVRTPMAHRGPGGWTSVRRVLISGAPLGLAQATNSLLAYVPVLFLSVAGNDQDVGLLAVSLYFITFGNLFYNSLQQVAITPAVAAFETGGESSLRVYFSQLNRAWVPFGALASLTVFAVGPELIETIYGSEFTISRTDLLPVALCLLVLPLVYSSGLVLMVTNRYRRQFNLALCALATVVLVALVVMGRGSVFIAAGLVLIGFLIRALGGLLLVHRAVHQRRVRGLPEDAANGKGKSIDSWQERI